MEISELEGRVKAADKNGSIKLNISHNGEMEGIWAVPVTPEDKQIYDSEQIGQFFEVFLTNQALIGGPSWGARLRLKTNGNSRSVISVSDVIEQIKAAVIAGDYPSLQTFEEYYRNQGE